MSKAARRLTRILTDMHEERFGGEDTGQFRIGWSALRELAGGGALGQGLLSEIAERLAETDHVLIPLADAILVAADWELECRQVPGQLVDKYLAGDEDDDLVDDDDDEEDVE